jgi:UDP-N-acetylglucosamine:LPS N-acetylglucosamine transferase
MSSLTENQAIQTVRPVVGSIRCEVCKESPPKVLAISSGGGHWVQLLRLRPAFEGCSITFVTVDECYRDQVPGSSFAVIKDATRWNKLALVQMACQVAALLLRLKPAVVISTGAAPGYIAIRLAKMIGAKTIWIDSMANVERLSLSGAKVGKYADLWLTQWPHLAKPEGPHFLGAVL